MDQTRRHLLFLLEGLVADQLQSIRSEWDPEMASRIPPHVSLVYPEEVTDETLLMERARTTTADTEAFVISLGALAANDQGRGGVWFGVRDPSNTWTRLRSKILLPPFQPIPIEPHATVVHPRTSSRGAEAFAALTGSRLKGDILITELSYTETSESGMQILNRLHLKLVPSVQVVAGLLRRDGRVLLCHRTPHRSHYPDVWDLPGGRVEPGENLVDALARELQEELGIITRLSQESAWLTLTDDDFQLHIYLVDDWIGELSNLAPDEHDEMRWTRAGEAVDLDLADSSYVQILERALS